MDNANAPPRNFLALLEDGLTQPEETGPAQPEETDAERRSRTWENPAWRAWYDTHDRVRCAWNIGSQTFTAHGHGCEYPEFDPAYWQEIIAVEERAAAAAKERAAALRAAEPKSRHRGRITDHNSARKELERMAKLAKDDPRFTPCMAFVYGHLANRGFQHGSVFVMAGAEWLSRWSDDRFTERQCGIALDRLELLGYISKVPWTRVKRRDRGLFDYAKRRYGGNGGRWANAYLLRQDLPERDVVPDEENPILAIMGLSA